MENELVKLSIICEAYNQEKYIRRCLDGFLMQKVNFKYEILINDDASTDDTVKIIEEYVKKYPDIFVPTYQNENLYPRGIRSWVDIQLPLAKGKYIAFCEGDDYWTDPYKLQKQVDFLDTHPDYSVTFHRYHILNKDYVIKDGLDDMFINKDRGITVSTEMFLQRWMTQFLTIVYRKDSFDFTDGTRQKYKYFRDSHLVYILLQNGKGFLMNFFGGVYRRTGDGVYTKMLDIDQCIRQIDVFEELWRINDDVRVKKQYYNSIKIFISNFKHNAKARTVIMKYALKLLLYNKNIISFCSTLLHIFKSKK